jgi:1-acyl-sn-glycerol-3-phosphate acyltransferase
LDGLPITRALRPFYAWYGDMTLVGHLWNVFKFGHFTIDVTFHPPVTISNFPDRKALAQYCQREVARGIEQSLTGRRLASEKASAKLPAPASGTLIDAKV